MTDCINLRERFGDRYKIGFDPAYDPKHRPKDKLDPWYMTIPCRAGTIYPYGGTRLAVEVEGRPKLKARLARLDCTERLQDGDDGFGAFAFDADDLDAIAQIVQPRRRRQVSETERERLRRMGEKHGFAATTAS